MKFIKAGVIIVLAILLNACRKEDPRPENPEVAPQRDRIAYKMTLVPRAENVQGDTLIVKVNGVYPKGFSPVKGFIGEKYGMYDVFTGDVLEVHYHPGKVTYHGVQMLDENGLAIYLDYNVNNNMLLKEFSCRCIGDYTVTIP